MTAVTRKLAAALADRYQIERRLGEGGMATVYLANDRKHDRKVALKVLKAELAAVLGAERFIQEIKTTASLQHPHILPLFDSGEADGFLYYVMPFIDGETLREKLDRETQLGIDEAVAITTAIAGALDYAHRHNVIHRDIKPENILLHEGRPMVADFGIALAVSAAAGGRMTETGLSLGTPHYMSPEQATAEKDITHRSDIYSLGSVLYEMLTGEPPHMGTSAQAIIMKIVTEPADPVTKLRKSVPPNVTDAVTKSLEKLAADRFASAAKFGAALTDPGFTVFSAAAPVRGTTSTGRQWNRTTTAVAGVAIVAAIAAVWGWARPTPSQAPGLRVRLDFPESQTVVSDARSLAYIGAQLALSPDGSMLVYSGPGANGGAMLWSRHLYELDARPLAGTEGAYYPVFSPAGDRVAFLTVNNQLRVVPAEGGPVVTIADSGFIWNTGLSWGQDGMLYATDGVGAYHIVAVSYADGSVTRVTRSDSSRQGQGPAYPYALPDGSALLVKQVPEMGAPSDYRLAAVDLQSGEVSDLGMNGVGVFFLQPEHLVVVQHDGTVIVVPFDESKLEITGSPVPIEEGIKIATWGDAAMTVSRTGTLLYQTGIQTNYRAAWVSRDGQVRNIDAPWGAGTLWTLALSPNQDRLAASIIRDNGTVDVWIHELASGHVAQFTIGGDRSFRPSWHPDGASIAFVSNRDGLARAYRKRADAGAAAELLLSGADRIEEVEWSRDGDWVLYRTETPLGNRAVMAIRPGIDSVATQLNAPESDAFTPTLSPDGRLLAYVSLEEGQRTPDVYVQPFLGSPDARVKASTEGGTEPRWSHSGRELFYRNLHDQLVAVEVGDGPGIAFGAREVILGGKTSLSDGGGRSYDVARGDSVFVVVRYRLNDGGEIVLVSNWLEELKAKVGN